MHLQLGDLLGPAWRPYFQWREFVMGVVFVAMLLTMKEIGKRSKCAGCRTPGLACFWHHAFGSERSTGAHCLKETASDALHQAMPIIRIWADGQVIFSEFWSAEWTSLLAFQGLGDEHF